MQKTLNTFPFGRALLIVIAFDTVVLALIGVVMLVENNSTGYGMLGMATLFSAILFYCLMAKFWNRIHFSDKEVWHKKERISWENVYLTVSQTKPPVLIRATFHHNIVFYMFFDRSFLSKDEAKSKRINRKGFYILLKPTRAKQILPLYQKQVQVLDNSLLFEKYLGVVYEHNKKIENGKKV